MVSLTDSTGIENPITPTFRTSIIAFDWYRIAFFAAGIALTFWWMRRAR